MPDVERPWDAQRDEKRAREATSTRWALFVAGVVLVAFVAWAFIDDAANGPESDGPEGSSYVATKNCERAAADQLKDPTSAEFSDTYAVPTDSGGAWDVSGIVSGRNPLGGTVAHDFKCRAISTDGTWSATVTAMTTR